MEQIRYVIMGRTVIIRLPEEIDDFVCRGIKEQTDRYIKDKKIIKIIFDFSRTSFMDSSGIGILLGRYKRMNELGGSIYVTGESEKIKRLLKISGVYHIVEHV